MRGQPPLSRRSGGGQRPPPPGPSQTPPPPQQNMFFLQNPSNPYIQNPAAAAQLLQAVAPLSQFQRPSLSFQNAYFPPPAPVNYLYNQSWPPQPRQDIPMPNFDHKPPSLGFQAQLRPSLLHSRDETLMRRIDCAAAKARRDLVNAGEGVTLQKVSEAVLAEMQVESWSDLGFQMQEVPSLNRLMVTEGKINAFIHCFVGVRLITSLYELGVAICKNEAVKKFEELELGPLLQNPLVLDYFSVDPGATEVLKITSEQLISYLYQYMEKHEEKEVLVEEFLEYIVKKRSVSNKENLTVRIQSLGLHMSFIQEARRFEDATLKKFLNSMKGNDKRKKRPLFSLQKKQIDDRFSMIRQRIKSFSSAHKQFHGKHIRFTSSSSDDEESDETEQEDKKNEDKVNSLFKLPSESNRSDRVSACPYPSASEERARLGLDEIEVHSPFRSISGHNQSPSKKKRKTENSSGGVSASNKLPRVDKIDKASFLSEVSDRQDEVGLGEDDLLLPFQEDHLRSASAMFVSTWKETCREQKITEIFKRLLQSYSLTSQERKNISLILSRNPFLGLLNVAVTAIRNGIWDNIYDTLQAIGDEDTNEPVNDEPPLYETIDVLPSKNDTAAFGTNSAELGMQSVPVDDVIREAASYFEHSAPQLGDNCILDRQYLIFKELYGCECWLTDQFSIKNFESLGHGNFFSFLEKHSSQFPSKVQKLFSEEIFQKASFGVLMGHHQLTALVSQASHNLWGDEDVEEGAISALLRKQYPSIDLKVEGNGLLKDFLKILREHKDSSMHGCVLFSASMIGLSYDGGYVISADVKVGQRNPLETGINCELSAGGQSIRRDAIEVLLKAPMLSDLLTWSHWETKFAPRLGHLVDFLLNEVNSAELLCLVTKNGKVIRINHSASVNSFLEAVLKASSFLTAVELTSLFSLVGGEKHVPLSLLKSHSCRAFEVILANSSDCIDVDVGPNDLSKKIALREKLLGEEVCSHINKVNMSRFFLDCLVYVPSEYWGFAADVLLNGMRSVLKDASARILKECNQLGERIMLHSVGVSLGLVEWAENFTVTEGNCNMVSKTSGVNEPVSELITRARSMDETVDEYCSSKTATVVSDANNYVSDVKSVTDNGGNEVAVNSARQHLAEVDCPDAMYVIESIRRDEFGLDLNLSITESGMLRKQHARLGRALHCLSQELYSQDSHFLLELVQNADDNSYPDHVEPTLTFILHSSGIVVLNNERGFSAENIRALCDVGNSTKKGSRSGYIGQKGIGFKSVFRVTDAPEIHSNGFHIKFDITEGQIGFILPTPIPPCDITKFSNLVSGDVNQVDDNCWNTCISLPWRSKLSNGTAMSSIIAMFSDLHPSLLLFLHRLRCITLRNMLNDSFTVMRKESLGKGIVKVSHGKDATTWLVVSKKLQSVFIRNDVLVTEISMAFTLDEVEHGCYISHLEPQPVFAFLPLRTYGLRFIIQGDFVLPSSREEVDTDSPWNQWLLSHFPDLFIGAKDSFCGLPCFREKPARAVSVYLSFVPLLGEVHGFFSGLPKMIISRLRMSSCLLLDRDQVKWVPPCKVLRGWDKLARIVLTDELLDEHLGLGFLHRDIVLSDQLAKALGIKDCSPKILLQLLSSLSDRRNGLKSMGLSWLTQCINMLYRMLQNSGHIPGTSEVERDAIKELQRIAFIPLSDGSYSSLDKGMIWLHANASSTEFDGQHGLVTFPIIRTKLRIVDTALFTTTASDMSSLDEDLSDNVRKMLQKVGVRQLSAHEILITHVLPGLSDDKNLVDSTLEVEYFCFVMVHLQSGCPNCFVEKENIMSALRNTCVILTNHGFKRITEVPFHFSDEYGCSVSAWKLINGLHMEWHMVDPSYLRHPATQSLSSGPEKWRRFFQEVGIVDFLRVVPVEKSTDDILDINNRKLLADMAMTSVRSVVKDWESTELACLLSLLSTTRYHENCKYLLEMLDKFWESDFHDKVTAYCQPQSEGNDIYLRSSFINTLCDARWVVSTMDNDLHYPRDLFYDCDKVRAILGAFAPYAVPKVSSEKLLHDIGFKTTVDLDDVLVMLKHWEKSEVPFRASLAQMTRLYTFIWDEMASSRRRIVQELRTEKFVFYPSASKSRSENVVSGEFYTIEEVCWHDPTGSVEQINELYSQCNVMESNCPAIKTLQSVYPGLHDFFVMECGALEIPSPHSYVCMLLRLSSTVSPSQASEIVVQIFLKLNAAFESGVHSNEIIDVRHCLMKQEYTVLPTLQDKWVSLHPSFGVVCWCDDENLMKEFIHLEGINFLTFGQSIDHEVMRLRILKLMQRLGIPALSEVATREAIFDGPVDSSFEASLLNWALPYAQRYIYTMHPQNYVDHCGCNNLKDLRVLVVEKLLYRNAIKSCNSASNSHYECSCILQGNVLYVAKKSDSHALFSELSRVWFDGSEDLHTANFLHMITVMARSGSTKEQIETFISNSQRVKKLPDEEPVWALSALQQHDQSFQLASSSAFPNVAYIMESKSNLCNFSHWPFGDWKTSPEFYHNEDYSLRTQVTLRQQKGGSDNRQVESPNVIGARVDNVEESDIVWNIRGDSNSIAPLPTLPNIEMQSNELIQGSNQDDLLDFDLHSRDSSLVFEGPAQNSAQFRWKVKFNNRAPNPVQAQLTGRLGELVAFKYFMGKVGNLTVKWVNEDRETGLPYDLVIGEAEVDRQYIEVKATKNDRKDWFTISPNEWQFAVEKGESFSIAHVALLENNEASVSIFKNPLKLCRLGKLQMLIMMPRQENAFPSTS